MEYPDFFLNTPCHINTPAARYLPGEECRLVKRRKSGFSGVDPVLERIQSQIGIYVPSRRLHRTALCPERLGRIL